MPPPAWFFLSIASMAGLHVLAPGPLLLSDAWSLAGLIPITGGIAINAAAVLAFRRRATTTDPEGQPTVLVTKGVYRFTRNPMYLGGILILLGFALLLGSSSPFSLPPLYALIARVRFLPAEERRLAAAFPAEYARYRRRTPRWL
ncbi:MAG TPA: isoprenylcysteine carboxylmethyltransferase family protein [Longimicrobiales bacterium]|nr:isoprenylcysteine carboxylmethyltransferase family protein [Longimicrobiales bacterium]